MQRSIKFRAWNGKWMDNDLFIGSDGTIYDRASRTYDTPNLEIETVQGMILMQFTGLQDKNGKEIYEGDIVRAGVYTEVVEYSEYGAWFFPFGNNWDALSAECCEVIGNIFENPELLNNGRRRSNP